MASLNGQTIASSYEQLLHVDRDGGGNSTTLVDVKDGDNGTTFALKLATDKIQVNGSSDLDGAVTINESSADADFRVESNGNTHMLFVDGGNNAALIGTGTFRNNLFNTTLGSAFQIEGTDAQGGSMMITRNTGASAGDFPFIALCKSRGSSLNSNTIVANDDEIGSLSFQGNDGAEFVEAASIRGKVGSTPGSNDMPGELLFYTTADGGVSGSLAMTIDSSQRVGIGTTSPTNALLEVKTDDENIARFDGLQGNIDFRYGSDIEFDRAGQVYITANNGSGELNFRTGGQNTRMHIDSDGKVGIGTDSPGYLTEIRVNDTTVDTPRLVIRQLGAGDASLAFQVPDSPYGWVMGVDQSSTESFVLGTGVGNLASAKKFQVSTGGFVIINDNDSGSAGSSLKQLSLGDSSSTQFDATNAGTFTGLVVSNSYGNSSSPSPTQVGTATGIAFSHHSSSSGISYVVSKAGSQTGDRSSLHFGTRGSDGVNERMVIMDNSYVGIGTNNPTEKLTLVGGDILVDSARGVRASGGNEMIRFDNTNGVRINSGGKNVVSFKRDSSILHHGAGTNNGMTLYKHTSGSSANLLFTVVLNNASSLYHLTVCEITIAHIGNANPRAVSHYIWEIENHNSFASDRPAIQTPVLSAGDAQSITVGNATADTATFQINGQGGSTTNIAAYFRVVSGVTGVSSLT